MSTQRRQAGDTIVEVLVATALLAFVIGAAYALTNRSVLTIRAAQERMEAMTYIEGQIERLKYEARSDPAFNTNFRVLSGFCFDQASGNKVSLPNAYCNTGPDGRYQIEVTYTNNPSFTDPNKRFGTFNVKATWPSVTGNQDRLTIHYQT